MIRRRQVATYPAFVLLPFLLLAFLGGCAAPKPGDVLPPAPGRGAVDADGQGGSDTDADAGASDQAIASDDGASDGEPSSDAPVDAISAEPCASTCDSAGAFRCATDTQIQVCSPAGGCLQWVDLATCAANQLCCNGACSAIDAVNCYACGNTCSAQSPVCSSATQSCGCTEQACRATGTACNTATRKCVRAAVYVDQAAAAGGDGTPAAPFRTITAAIAAASAGSAKDRLILVAAGTYDDTHGETFPLVLRGGLSIEGAGPAATKIQGVGIHSVAPGDSPMSIIGTLSPTTTVVVGDALATSQISHLSVLGTRTPVDSHIGIFCDRGNLSDYDAPTASIEPNTLIDDVVLQGYVTSLFAASARAPAPSGCNIRITRSTFTNSLVGLRSGGCDPTVDDWAAPVDEPIPVAVDLGDGTADGGNTFSNLTYDTSGIPYGAVATIDECTKTFRARYNTFRQSDAGVWSLQPERGGQLKSTWIVEHNIFDTVQLYGITLYGGAIEVSSLADNVFQNISNSFDNGAPLAGLVLMGTKEIGTAFPRVVKGRRNTFIGNDAGILIRADGQAGLMPQTPVSDFGTVDDPGENVFSCNSSRWNRVSGDVVVMGMSSGSIELPFAKNHWDHATPTRSITVSGTNGADILLPAGTTVTVDATPGTPTTIACTAGHVPGDVP